MKKILLFLTIAILSFSLLTACGSGENSTSNSNSNENSSGGNTTLPQTVEVNVDLNATENGAEINGVKTYKTIQSAVDYVATFASSDIKIINIAAGDYNEKITVVKEITNLKLVGSTTGTTKITYGDYAAMLDENGNKIGTDKTATANVHADGFTAENIYFENSFDFFRTDITSDKQALAMYCKADKVQFINCIFTGYQDTLEVVSGRQYFKNCTIKGCVDFIFGNNPSVLFDNCDIVTVNRNDKNGGYITAMKGNNGTNGSGVATYGLVFKGCRLTAEKGVVDHSVALGRPWRADATVAWINCEMGAHIGLDAEAQGNPRYTTMSGGGLTNYPMNAHFAEYGNTGLGATSENLYCRYPEKVNGKLTMLTATIPDFKNLTSDEAALYTPENIFATVNGGVTYTGEWNPCA